MKIEVVDASIGRRVAGAQVEQSERNTIWLQDSLARSTTRLLRARLGDLLPDLVSAPGTRSPAAWNGRQRAREAVWNIDRLSGANVPAALQKLAEADSILANVETNDEFWTEPIVERARLSLRRALLYPESDARFAQHLEVGLAHVDRVLHNEPNDANALEMRGTLRFFQWVSNLAPNAGSAKLLRSAEQDLVIAVASPTPRPSAWNTLSLLRLNTRDLAAAAWAAENALRQHPFLPSADVTVERLFLVSLDLGLHDEAMKWCEIGHARFPHSDRFAACRLWLYALPSPNTPIPDEVWRSYDDYVNKSAPAVRDFNKLKGRLIVALALVRAGQRDSAIALANTSWGDSLTDPWHYLLPIAAGVYSRAGAMDSAVAMVRRILAVDPERAWLASGDKSWWLKELRSDPRYPALVQRRR